MPDQLLCPSGSTSFDRNQGTLPLISLIVPVWHDDELAIQLVTGLTLSSEVAEWIIAAVNPGNALRQLHQQGAIRLVSCAEPSRGRQMNAGAAAARGSLLCFHHADSELRIDHLTALEQVARNELIFGGAFHRRLDNQSPLGLVWEQLVKVFNLSGGPFFGDQSIFVKASVFKRLHGFADIPLMEDIDFSRRLRRYGRVVLLDPALGSSPRRFRRLGNWRTTLLNAAFIGLFYLGINPSTLHKWYYRSHWRSSGNQRRRS